MYVSSEDSESKKTLIAFMIDTVLFLVEKKEEDLIETLLRCYYFVFNWHVSHVFEHESTNPYHLRAGKLYGLTVIDFVIFLMAGFAK